MGIVCFRQYSRLRQQILEIFTNLGHLGRFRSDTVVRAAMFFFFFYVPSLSFSMFFLVFSFSFFHKVFSCLFLFFIFVHFVNLSILL